MTLDVDAARAAVQTIADAMGLESVEQAAEGILAIVNENMAGALRLVSVQRGHDPREFALVAYGGAGPAARQRAREADGLVPGDRPAGAGPALRDRRPRRRLPRRVRADVHPARSADASGDEVARDPRRARRRARRTWLEGEGIADERAARRLHRRHALPPARATRSRSRSTRTRCAGRPRRPRGALQRAARAALRVPDARTRPREIVNLRAVGYGDRAEARAAGRRGRRRRRVGRRRRRARGRLRRASACRRRSTTARSSQPGRAHRRARRSSPSSTRRPSSCPATRPRSTATSTS